jgi:hypothetical protein
MKRIMSSEIPPEPGRLEASQLFRYLQDLISLRSPLIRDLSKYERVIWFGDFTRLPEIEVIDCDLAPYPGPVHLRISPS